jgi:hypothetical protein
VEEPSKDVLNSLANVVRTLKDSQVVKIRDQLKETQEHPALIAVVEREIRWRKLPRVREN